MTDVIKLLIVDDVAENLIALEALLRRDGVAVLCARSGAEALELLLVHDVAIAVVDVQMPEMDGFELAELMRGATRTKHVPIIFITAGARDPTRVFKGYESGAVDFLFKPIDPHILKSKIEVFLELADQRRRVTEALRLNELFVGILGHDLRNPLGAMIAGTELL
jgi:two-component system, sensor histidine kinase and response regulator